MAWESHLHVYSWSLFCNREIKRFSQLLVTSNCCFRCTLFLFKEQLTISWISLQTLIFIYFISLHEHRNRAGLLNGGHATVRGIHVQYGHHTIDVVDLRVRERLLESLPRVVAFPLRSVRNNWTGVSRRQQSMCFLYLKF